jgi:ribosomal protein L7/L12/uncharacterized protein YegL
MSDAFELTANLEPARLAPGREAEVMCHLRLRAWSHLFAAGAPPTMASVCLVFDCSTSMIGAKLQTAIDAAKGIVDIIHERQRISLVGFQSHSSLIVDNAQASADKKGELRARIDNMRGFVGGSTNLAAGIREGRRAIESQPADAKVIVILSDGEADDHAAAERAAVEASAAGIQIFAVGLGTNFEAGDLLKLVTPSNGAVFGGADGEKIKATFARLIGRIDAFVATQAKLVITLSEGVRARSAYKTSPERAFLGTPVVDATRNVTLTVGNLERDETYAFLLGMMVPARPKGEHELARATLSYDAPALGLHGHTQELVISMSHDEDPTDASNSELVAAIRGARRAELVQSLAAAHRQGDRAAVENNLARLIDQAEEPMRADYENMLSHVRQHGAITQERLNALIVGGTAKAEVGAHEGYDVVLLAAGPQLIRIVREVRAMTGLSLRKVSDLVSAAPSTLRQAVPQADAAALQKKLESFGAKVSLKRR